MPILEMNGAKLYYEEHGSGPEVIVFGQGQSEVTRNGYDMDTLSEDAVTLIEKLNCKTCHFLGFSMGGFVGLRLAIRHKELLRSLILVDTSADPERKENLRKYWLLNIIPRWIGPWAVAAQVMRFIFGEVFLNDPERLDLSKKWRQSILGMIG